MAILSIFSLLFYLGLYFFILPAIWVMARFIFALFVSVDKNLSLFKAFSFSYKISSKSTVSIMIFMTSLLLLNFLAAVALFPLFFTLPFSSLAVANLYKTLSESYIKQGARPLALDQNLNKLVYFVFFLILFFVFLIGLLSFIKNHKGNGFLITKQQSAYYNLSEADKDYILEVKLLIESYKESLGSYPDNLKDLQKINPDFKTKTGLIYKKEGESYTLCFKNTCI